MIVVDFWQFAVQSVALVAWIFVVAGAYFVVEKALGGPAPSGGE